MPHDELKPKDRVVLRMTRDGAVEEKPHGRHFGKGVEAP